MKYIPVRFFTNYMEAHIALGQLQEQGIDCVLEDENTLTVMPMLTQALGGIKLMVAEPDLAAAKELL